MSLRVRDPILEYFGPSGCCRTRVPTPAAPDALSLPDADYGGGPVVVALSVNHPRGILWLLLHIGESFLWVT